MEILSSELAYCLTTPRRSIVPVYPSFQTLASPSGRAGDEGGLGHPRTTTLGRSSNVEPMQGSAPTVAAMAVRVGSTGRRGSAGSGSTGRRGSMASIPESTSSEAPSGETSPETAAWNPVGFATRRLGKGRLPPRAAGVAPRVISVNLPLSAPAAHLQMGSAGRGARGCGAAGAAVGGAARAETASSVVRVHLPSSIATETPSRLAGAMRSSPNLEAILTPQSWHLTTPVSRRRPSRVLPPPDIEPFSPLAPSADAGAQSARLPAAPDSPLREGAPTPPPRGRGPPSPPPRAAGRGRGNRGTPEIKQAWFC